MGIFARSVILLGVLFAVTGCLATGQVISKIEPAEIAPMDGKGQLVIYRPSSKYGGGLTDAVVNPYGFAQAPRVVLEGGGLTAGGTHDACRYNSTYIINLPAGNYTVTTGGDNGASVSVSVANGRRTFVKCKSVQGLVGISMEIGSVSTATGEEEFQRTELIGSYTFN